MPRLPSDPQPNSSSTALDDRVAGTAGRTDEAGGTDGNAQGADVEDEGSRSSLAARLFAALRRRGAAVHSLARAALEQSPSWLVSMVLHMILLVVLGLLTIPVPDLRSLTSLVVSTSGKSPEPIEDFPLDLPSNLETKLADSTGPSNLTALEDLPLSPVDDLDTAPTTVELNELGLNTAPRTDLLRQSFVMGTGVHGRGEQNRAALVRQRGGNEASERAVALALEWLADHQHPDGGWSFDHRQGSCNGRCRNWGQMTEARNAATALALLPFLGAGETHKEGKYKKNISAGIAFLRRRIQQTRSGGSLYEPGGRLYSHGLAAIALCEAYAMTRDQELYDPVREVLRFTCYAQDPNGGGWRYEPRQPGDTSAVGWQIMALKSGHMAYIEIPPQVIRRAEKFLDSVEVNNGRQYGYKDTSRVGEGTTAVAALCRMYLGWKRDHRKLRRVVNYLDRQGPDPNNLYYDYYATQVMHHYEGEEWQRWNRQMRDHLINTQAQEGHERGSWYLEDPHGHMVGGRLYCTAMAAMILEVYYRHMPLYGKDSLELEFPD